MDSNRVEIIINKIKQLLPLKFIDVLNFVSRETGKRCVMIPDLDIEDKVYGVQVDSNIYAFFNNDFGFFKIVCHNGEHEDSYTLVVPNIVTVYEDMDNDKLFIFDIDTMLLETLTNVGRS